MASFDDRRFPQTPVFKFEVPQITLPNGASAAIESSAFNIHGVVKQVSVKINNTTNSVTARVQIIDTNDTSIVYFDETSIAENATTMFRFIIESSTDLSMNIPIAGGVTVKVTPSGDPGASTMLADITLWGN